MTDFRTRLGRRDLLVGPLVTLSDPAVSEAFVLAGCDWLWLDLEHTPLSLAEIQNHIRAVAGRAGTVVRVPWNDPVHVKQVLDFDCDGVIVPQVRTADEARAAVAAAKYPPEGIRSVGIARAHRYGLNVNEYVQSANKSVAVILQLEHVDVLPHVADILAVSSVDAVLVGPYDLSASMGRPGQITHPDVVAAVTTIAEACNRHGKPWGAFAPDAASAKSVIARGATLVAVGTDAMYLWRGARSVLAELRPAGP
jgi:2-keto-3-deoxy-L-rhamnonate aldolase RhmA